MLFSLKNIKISQKLGLFTFGLLFIIVIFGFISFTTVNNTKVNGEIYKEIVLGKDLIADILPPPEYILESYLVCNQLYFESDQNKIGELCENIKKLKSDFELRHKYWIDNLETGEIKNTLIKDSYVAAIEFYKLAEEQYIPAIRSKNKELAENILKGTMKDNYEIHRKAIDKVVELANTRNSIKEENAKQIINSNIILMSIIALISVILSIILSIITIRSIVNPIKKATEIAMEMAKGDFEIINKYLSNN